MDRDLVHFEPVADGVDVGTMIVALHSPLDAGHSAELVADHLLGSLQHERLATFDSDEILDFQRHRPVIYMDDGVVSDLRVEEVAVDMVRDDEGNKLLLLHGPEPDMRWNGFLSEVMDLSTRFGVRNAFMVQSFPGAAPHTRPTVVNVHTDTGVIGGLAPYVEGRFEMPAKMASIMELAFRESGIGARGYVAMVPHYLAHHPYPAAAAELVRNISQDSDLALPVGELDAAGAKLVAQLDDAIGDEVATHIQTLETQFDSEQGAGHISKAYNGTEVQIPTADEIGAAAEAFLADLDAPPRPESGDGEDGL